ncbi:exo-alpha-sialidase [Olleya sp. 1-3]|uniref:exo-alpha-sialidase n=1 Tax=Olleya sp. 1-3 TaxID=2058323 RepID=UPI001E5ECFE1|nr:exo-alpha-sialidase [Olleya sp. 1-3]
MRLKYIPVLALTISLICLGCKEVDANQETTLNLAETKNRPTLFGDGIISTGLYQRDLAVSPDGNQLMYTLGDYKQQRRSLVQLNKVAGVWSKPELVSFSGVYQDIEPFYTNQGNTLFFASNRPINNDNTRKDYNIWYSHKTEGKWGEPKPLNNTINTTEDEFYPSLSNNGNLYFTATKPEGIGKEDLFVSKKVNGVYQKPSVLDSTINTKHYEFNAYVNPEENLLIFSSYGRADGFGGGDLYYSLKDKSGRWSPSKNMGKDINSDKLDFCPFVDVNRNTFYFTSERVVVDSSKINSIKEFKVMANRAQNGTGNIYSIGLDALHLEL